MRRHMFSLQMTLSMCCTALTWKAAELLLRDRCNVRCMSDCFRHSENDLVLLSAMRAGSDLYAAYRFMASAAPDIYKALT